MFTWDDFAFQPCLKKPKTEIEADKGTYSNRTVILQRLLSCRQLSQVLCGARKALLNKLIGEPVILA